MAYAPAPDLTTLFEVILYAFMSVILFFLNNMEYKKKSAGSCHDRDRERPKRSNCSPKWSDQKHPV